MKKNACELSSSPTLFLFGKSIAYHNKKRTIKTDDKTSTSISTMQTDIIMRHSQRIKQLFRPVCLHEVKHEIANHYRDAKRRKAGKKRIKARRSLATALRRLRKRNPNSRLAATARAIVNRRRTTHRRPFLLNSREVLQIPSFTFPRAITQQPTTLNVRKGRQTLCNINRPNDITAAQIVEPNPKTAESITTLINCLFEKVCKNSFAVEQTTINRKNQAKENFKSVESVGCQPLEQSLLQRRHKAQTCRRINRRSEKQTCTTTNQSHVEIRRIDSKTPPAPPNCNYSQPKKTYSSSLNDDNRNCINSNYKHIDTNFKTEWYIELASNCYRNGFQSHVNHLDECSKHPSVLQKKPAQVVQPSILRLPTSALISSRVLPSTPTQIGRPVSLLPALHRCSSSSLLSKSIKLAANHPNYSFSDKSPNECCLSQLNNGDKNRIYCKKRLSFHTYGEPSPHHYNHHWPIEDNFTTLPIDRQPIETKQFIASNAKNNMNSAAIDADHFQQNLQLSSQTIQYNYPNNNLTFHRELQSLGGQQVPPPSPQIITENNNYHHQHWLDENNTRHPIPLSNRQSIAGAVQSTIATSNGDIVNDLIEAFNCSFDVSDVNQQQQSLPQIILSDFSSEQLIPPTTPILFTVPHSCIRKQSEHPTTSQHPTQLQEFQFNDNNLIITHPI